VRGKASGREALTQSHLLSNVASLSYRMQFMTLDQGAKLSSCSGSGLLLKGFTLFTLLKVNPTKSGISGMLYGDMARGLIDNSLHKRSHRMLE